MRRVFWLQWRRAFGFRREPVFDDPGGAAEDPALKIIVGLGNPGERYARTRHNVGFRVVDALAQEAGAEAWSRKCLSLVCRADVGGHPVLLAKPSTFMNLSGRAVERLLAGNRVDRKDLIVILDDLNLPLGRIRIREQGSAGGHRGLESVLRALGGEALVRVRLGIGDEDVPAEKASFVLSDFPQGRERELEKIILKACDVLRVILTDGVSRAMSVFNA